VRRSDENTAEASLELLLDTICNAFGGILFLTIMMALLLKVSSRSTEPGEVTEAARHEIVQQETQLQEALATLDSLRSTLAVQGNTYERLIDPNVAANYRVLQDRERQRDEAQRVLFELVRERATATAALDELTQQRKQEQAKQRQFERNLAKRLKELEDAAQRQTATIHPSRTRSTSKQEYVLVVRYDRLYVLFRDDLEKLMRKVNRDDFLVLPDDKGNDVATPKPYAGLPIDADRPLGPVLATLLRNRSPQRYYVALAVWEDSFDAFLALREALVAAGYEYRLLPLHQESVLNFGDVTDPQVQ
jgi:hypothetical protein